MCVFCNGTVGTHGQMCRLSELMPGYSKPGAYAERLFAEATCITCEAKYIAWINDRPAPCNYVFTDLSHRSTFNDEPGPKDMPKWKIEWVAKRTEWTDDQA